MIQFIIRILKREKILNAQNKMYKQLVFTYVGEFGRHALVLKTIFIHGFVVTGHTFTLNTNYYYIQNCVSLYTIIEN